MDQHLPVPMAATAAAEIGRETPAQPAVAHTHTAALAASPPQAAGSATQADVFEAIVAHLQEHGSCKWRLVFERPEFAELIGPRTGECGRRKFWRWVAAVKEGLAADRTKPHIGRAAADQHGSWARHASASTAGLPVPAPAGYLRRAGGSGLQKLRDFAELIDEVLADAEAVRQSAVEVSEDGAQLTVRDGAMLMKVGKQKLDVASAGLRLWREVQQLMEHEQLYEGLYRVLHEELAFAPHVRARVLERVGELFSPAPANDGAHQ